MLHFSDRGFLKLEKLVFDLSDNDIWGYSNLVSSHQDLGSELEQKIIDKIRKQIDMSFVKAEAVLKVFYF